MKTFSNAAILAAAAMLLAGSSAANPLHTSSWRTLHDGLGRYSQKPQKPGKSDQDDAGEKKRAKQDRHRPEKERRGRPGKRQLGKRDEQQQTKPNERQEGKPDEGQNERGNGGEPQPLQIRAYWKEGLYLETLDGNHRVHIGGRIMNDYAFLGGSDALEGEVGNLQDGSEIRRARLFVSGYIYKGVEFKIQYDFAGGDANPKDVYIGTRGLPANVRVGHFKEPFSLEELTSSKFITFTERALTNVFAPSRNSGIMVHGKVAGERASYGFGVFRETDSFGDSLADKYNLTGRFAGTPIYGSDGHRLLHLGGAFTFKNVDNDGTLRFRQRPEVHLAPRFVDTGKFPADSAHIFNAEVATVIGPFSAQGEYTRAAVNSDTADDPAFNGWYVMASYWLTGEHRNYETKEAAFGRVHPKANFLDGSGGAGAWELAVRYSRLDLNDKKIAGGKLNDLTAGVNWHWNPLTRVMFNLVRARLDGVDSVYAFQARAQIDF
ncbi:MAG: OprO/OprP family phosphate-selective porin [Acidobacteriota bacterium]